MHVLKIHYRLKIHNVYIESYFLNGVVSENVQVISDAPMPKPLNGFNALSQVLTNVIKKSESRFTIGIYGEWGTGKTTLMELIEKKISDDQELDDKAILTVRFNAWRYEREEQFATIAMMNAIATEMINNKKFNNAGETIKKILKGIIRIFANTMTTRTMRQPLDEVIKEVHPKENFLDSATDNTTYSDMMNAIFKEMQEIMENIEGAKIVVLVDDLDRCLPMKALEVLESIKIFLDIEGFVYVLGINHDTISNAIERSHEGLGVKGSEYIKKIIQVPITLPSWEDEGLEDELVESIIQKLDEKYRTPLRTSTDRLFKKAKNNPRQLKRIINSFIVAYETCSNDMTELELDILLEAFFMKQEKPKFFSAYVDNDDERDGKYFRTVVYKFMNELYDLHNKTHEFKEETSVTLNYYQLSLYNLQQRINPGHGDDERDERDERVRILRNAFFNLLLHVDKHVEPPGLIPVIHGRKTSLKNMNAYKKFINVEQEFIKMSMGDWWTFKDQLHKMCEISEWAVYKKALNMMKEDLNE